jgi:hypothetical protein
MNYQDKADLYAKEIMKSGDKELYKESSSVQIITSGVTDHFARMCVNNNIGCEWTHSRGHITRIVSTFTGQKSRTIKYEHKHSKDNVSIEQSACEVYEAYQREFCIQKSFVDNGVLETIEEYGNDALIIYGEK